MELTNRLSLDLITTNAAILTMDPAKPRAEAIGISGNRISHLGSIPEVMDEKGAKTIIIDAGGGSVLPGFIEAHMHLFAGAGELEHLQLYGTRGFDELKARLLDYVSLHPGDELIIGEQAGARLIFATDWPVSDIDPMLSLQSAMTRPIWKDGLPDNRQNLDQSVRSDTEDSAYAGFMDGKTGVLKVRMLVDVVVLPVDLEKTDPASFKGIMPSATVCDGRVVFRV